MVSPSTLAPVLIAFGASSAVQGSEGKRDIPLAKFFQAPSSASEREHVLTPDEVLLSVTFTIRTKARNASYEVRQKQACDWPLVQAAVSFESNDDKSANNVSIVLGHV